MEEINGINGATEAALLQTIQNMANEPSNLDEFFASKEFAEIIAQLGVSHLMFHYMISRILETSVTDIIIEAMDLHK